MRLNDAYIALGANLGDRAANISAALDQLRGANASVIAVSSLIENPAVGGPAGAPDFLNGAAHLRTSLPARDLLERLLAIEHQIGRVRAQRWGPRLIDLDLLLYGNLTLHEPGLTLPHPRLHERRFVLEPLAEIAGSVIHPVLQVTIHRLLDQMNDGRRQVISP